MSVFNAKTNIDPDQAPHLWRLLLDYTFNNVQFNRLNRLNTRESNSYCQVVSLRKFATKIHIASNSLTKDRPQ